MPNQEALSVSPVKEMIAKYEGANKEPPLEKREKKERLPQAAN